jgi:DNA-binding transcriptional MerR regulator
VFGAFARLAPLTVKAVRHHDAQELPVPSHVDPHSGYRYHRAGQVGTATTIALLRGLDVPLPVVREVLRALDGDAVAAVLAGEREKLRAEPARREELLRSLDGLLRRPGRCATGRCATT